ncbi:MAG: DUF5711 family protein [Intestinimonas sp.]|nr:DUF5711 family protein [Intestinimonas sp.]
MMEENAEIKKRSLLRRTLTFLLTLVLLLGAILIVANRNQLNFDAVKRYFTYRSLERSDSGQAKAFTFDAGGKNCFTNADGDLLVTSSSGIRLYSPSGTAYLDLPLSLNTPAVDTCGESAVSYTSGGYDLQVLTKRESSWSLHTDTGSELLSARLNKNGWLAVTSRAAGYKGAVTVYDSSGSAKVGFQISSNFVMDGVVTDDNQSAAVLTVGQENNVFTSSLSFYHLDEDSPYAQLSLGNDVFLDLHCSGSDLWAVGENSLALIHCGDGTLAGTYDYSGRYLKSYSLGGSDFASLLLGKYRAGTSASLVTVDSSGKELASLDLSEQVLDLSSAGRYVAVLTANQLQIYTRNLKLYGSLDNSGGSRNVVLRDDGTAYLIGSESAQLFVPQ